MINCVRGKATLTFSFLEISFIESRKEKRIEVIFRTHPDADKMKTKKVFQDIYYIIIDVIDGIRKKCNIGGLQVKTLVHPPSEKTASCDFICINATGFITLTTVRQLLSMLAMTDGSSNYEQISCDSSFKIELNLLSMRRDSYWSVWEEKRNILHLVAGSCSAVSPLPAGKKTHVFLSHDWGIDGNNHNRVKQVSEALKSRGLITWIDDERIVNEINEKIIDGIDHTECMLVFMTENYVKKVNGWNYKDYCRKEFSYAVQKLGKEKILFVVLEKSMRNSNEWGGKIRFHVGNPLYVDMSKTSSLSRSTAPENCMIDDLYQRIVQVIVSNNSNKKKKKKKKNRKNKKNEIMKDDRPPDEVSQDINQGSFRTVNGLKKENGHKKRKKDELSSDEEQLNHDQKEENNIEWERKRENQSDSSLEVKNEQSQMTVNILKSNQSNYNSSNSSKKRRKKRRRLRLRLESL